MSDLTSKKLSAVAFKSGCAMAQLEAGNINETRELLNDMWRILIAETGEEVRLIGHVQIHQEDADTCDVCGKENWTCPKCGVLTCAPTGCPMSYCDGKRPEKED